MVSPSTKSNELETARSKVALLLSYDGSAFTGFQKQKNDLNIQGVLEKALSRMLDESIRVCGAGRTDAGVHARGQIVHFWTHKNPYNYKWLYALNGTMTPESLCVKGAWRVPDEFHAIGSAQAKTYKYLILNRPLPSAWRRHFVTHISKELDINYLNEMSKVLVGKKDFKSFQTSGTEVPHTVREIYKAHWEKKEKDILEFTIKGDGFLRQMVRNIVGSLIYMENNSLPASWLNEVIQDRDRQRAKGTAPPQGLYLYQVHYPKDMVERFEKLPWWG
ncbi:MAG: tRNA pseudouridine(38-40) synthase TruA [Bdellovibrionales bacterium]|nr:tRNA pseudouridine(38-40) synthase TruA [Bdellovibrionales bacterium]